jgi:HAD superfamily phosphoserine phosphatase-like hydrolase
MKRQHRALAILDLGGTLVNGDPVYLWAEHLYQQGRWPATAWEEMADLTRRYHRGMDPDQVAQLATQLFVRTMAGSSWEEILASAKACQKKVLAPRLFPFARPLVAALRQAGLHTVLVTGVASPLAEEAARELGVDEVYATPLPWRDGVLAEGPLPAWGDPLYPQETWKEARIRHHLEDPLVDLAESFAFGDSGADAGVLARVGRPVVVRPKPGLRELAQEKGWRVWEEAEDAQAQLWRWLSQPPWQRP